MKICRAIKPSIVKIGVDFRGHRAIQVTTNLWTLDTIQVTTNSWTLDRIQVTTNSWTLDRIQVTTNLWTLDRMTTDNLLSYQKSELKCKILLIMNTRSRYPMWAHMI